MTKHFVACYKVHRGGEFFEASLESICEGTDGAVVVFSEDSWVPSGLRGNCREPLRRFMERHPGYPVVTRTGDFRRGEPQYDLALATIREQFGENAAALIVDSDEVWEAGDVAKVEAAIQSRPECHYFRAGLYTYLRSPLYQVWPPETPHCCMAIQHCRPQEIKVRFSTQQQGPSCVVPDVRVHHFSYVRDDPRDIALKFQCTSAQEQKPSRSNWLETVWESLPFGTNLHMTPGFEQCWREIKVLPACPVAIPGNLLWVDAAEHWLSQMETLPPDKTIIPMPTAEDAKKYPEFADIHMDVSLLRSRLKMTYLEALVLHRLAGEIPSGGRILEIGSGSGGSMAVMALASDAELWAVDPFEPYDEQNITLTRGVAEGNEEQFWETANHYGYADRVRHIKKRSVEAAAECPDEGFDLVLADANHSYEFIRSDIALYRPKLKPGGLILVHDFSSRFPGVVNAVKESEIDFFVFAGTSIAYATK